MRVGIVQSSYIPWRGYFDLIDDVDVFVVFDDVQYTDRDWRNRNKLKTAHGLKWISVSVGQTSRDQSIQEIPIDWEVDWAKRHLDLLRESYRSTHWYPEISDEFSAILAQRFARLSELNVAAMSWAMRWLGIETRLVDAGSLQCTGRKTERLIALVQAVGGTTYLSGPSAQAYLDVAAIERAGLGLEIKSYDYQPYPQLWGAFEGAVSILDLLCNAGPDARRFLKSRVPNRVILPRPR